MVFNVVGSILLGAFAGWLANKIMHRKKGFWSNVLLGIAGSFVGGFLAGIIGLSGGLIVELLVAVAGACLVLVIANSLKR